MAKTRAIFKPISEVILGKPKPLTCPFFFNKTDKLTNMNNLMIICRKCGNCDLTRLKLEKHIFKNLTTHIKQHCYECGHSSWVTKKEAIRYANGDWITDHTKSISKAREKEFTKLRKEIREENRYNTISMF
jgi:phage terminase large subunit GpA-like protein